MSSLPANWMQTQLGELCEIARGGSPRPIKDYLTSDPGGINWVKIGDATASSKYIFKTKERIKPEGLKKSRLVCDGDFLLSNSMSFGRPYIMRTTGCIHDGWLVLRDRTGTLDQDYLYHFLGSPFAFHQFDRLAAGTTVRNLNSDLVKGVRVLLPPLTEQRRIVAKIDSLSAKSRRARDHLDHIPRLVERYKQAMLDRAFVSLPCLVPLQQQVVAERGIPYGIVQTGEPFDGGIPTVRCGDIKAFSVIREELKLVNPDIEADYRRTRLRGGEVLIAIRGSVGETCVVPPELIGCNISREVAMIPLKEGIEPTFIMYFLASSTAKKFILGNVKGVAQQGINLRDLKELPTPSCSPTKQSEVLHLIRSAFAWIDRLASETTSARKLIDHLDQAILAKAFRGELVPQDPNDEPASVLLERISESKVVTNKEAKKTLRARRNAIQNS